MRCEFRLLPRVIARSWKIKSKDEIRVAWLQGSEISMEWYFISLTSRFCSCRMTAVTVYPLPNGQRKNPKRRSASSTPRRAEDTPANYSNIVNPLLATYDGKGGGLSYAIGSVSWARSVISWQASADGIKQNLLNSALDPSTVLGGRNSRL